MFWPSRASSSSLVGLIKFYGSSTSKDHIINCVYILIIFEYLKNAASFKTIDMRKFITIPCPFHKPLEWLNLSADFFVRSQCNKWNRNWHIRYFTVKYVGNWTKLWTRKKHIYLYQRMFYLNIIRIKALLCWLFIDCPV